MIVAVCALAIAFTPVPEGIKRESWILLAIILAIALTLYQVPYLMNLPSEAVPINLIVRLFAWLITGALVAVLMYGKKNRTGTGRTKQTQMTGLLLSALNLVIWVGVTYWVLTAETHK